MIAYVSWSEDIIVARIDHSALDRLWQIGKASKID